MVKTIGNPLTWTAHTAGSVGHHMADATRRLGGTEHAPPKIRDIDYGDLMDSLRAGLDDFSAMRSDVMFIVLLYPLIGALMAWFAFNSDLVPYLFPMISGFALIGPFAATGLYEMSRRREAGLPTDWKHAADPLRSASFAPILGLGMYLGGIFLAWMVTAGIVYHMTLGVVPGHETGSFLRDTAMTEAGLTMVAIGIPLGAVFAALVLAISVVAFPMLVDRDVGIPTAVATSLRVTRQNPGPVLAWGAIVACLLAVGSLPLFLGLIVVMPVLGHASWHLYRKAVGPA